MAPFTILGLECDVKRQLTPSATYFQPSIIGGRIDRLDLITDGSDEYIRVVDYKTSNRRPKPIADVEAIFLPENIREHSDYYLQTFVYADIISRQRPDHKVSPALVFIQHAGGDNDDPTLCFGSQPVRDIAQVSARFNELLEETITEMFSPDVPFQPTSDQRTCSTCPFAALCRH